MLKLEQETIMKNLTHCVLVVAVAGTGFLWTTTRAESFGPFRHDGGKISCNDDRGPEIKETQIYKAPNDRFFKEDSIKVSEISGWGKAHSCTISNIKKQKISVQTDSGTFDVDVVTEFAVYAHADCGSGALNNSGGKTASVECSVTAEMQKFTNK